MSVSLSFSKLRSTDKRRVGKLCIFFRIKKLGRTVTGTRFPLILTLFFPIFEHYII